MPNLISPALSLSTAASWGAADFCGGIASRKGNVFGVVVIAHAVGWAFMLFLALLFGERIPTGYSLSKQKSEQQHERPAYGMGNDHYTEHVRFPAGDSTTEIRSAPRGCGRKAQSW